LKIYFQNTLFGDLHILPRMKISEKWGRAIWSHSCLLIVNLPYHQHSFSYESWTEILKPFIHMENYEFTDKIEEGVASGMRFQSKRWRHFWWWEECYYWKCKVENEHDEAQQQKILWGK
jgi:hypothetical protein